MNRRLHANEVLIRSGVIFVIENIDPKHDRVDLYAQQTGSKTHVALSLLRKEIAEGIVQSDEPIGLTGSIRESACNTRGFETFLFRTAVVAKITAAVRCGKTRREAIESLKGTMVTTSAGKTLEMCSTREAYRIMKLAGVSESALLPAYQSRGNRKPRYDDRITQIILKLVREHYAVTKSRITLNSLTISVNHAAHTEGVLAENLKVSRKFVREVILTRWNADLDYKRLDPKFARSAKAVATKRIRAGAPLNRVEIDTLHLPFLAQSEYGIEENMHLMTAIDCETSHPLSWWFMLTKPTTEDTFSCIERAIYPKADLLKTMDVSYYVDPYGGILNLVMDNGSENSKERLASITRVGINPQWTTGQSGHEKPFIERLNRSLKDYFHSLPGCTRFNGKDGARTDEARNDPLLSVGELEWYIVRWLFERWPDQEIERFITADYKIDEGSGIKPKDRWSYAEANTVLPICPPPEDWHRCRFLEIERSLSNKTGISCLGFNFRGENLKSLIDLYGPNALVKVHYNPHDYRTVYVPDKNGTWIDLVNDEVTDRTPAFSFDYATKHRGTVRGSTTRSAPAKKLDADVNGKALEKRKKPTRKQSQKEAHEVARSVDAVNRGIKSPLSTSVIASDIEHSHQFEDAIPNFTTHHTIKE